MKHVKCKRGFGRIADPETGEEYNVEGENTVTVSDAVAQRLKEAHAGIVVSEAGDSDDEPRGSDAEDGDEICGAEMTDGSECQRPASGCPYHD